MSFILKSKFVCRNESNNKGEYEGLFDSGLSIEDCNSGQTGKHADRQQNRLNHPHFKSSEYVSLQQGCHVYREKDQVVDVKDKEPVKRKRLYSLLEDEGPLVTFQELPHPKELFGKRPRPSKKVKVAVSKVDNHKMQLQKKMAQLDQARFKIARKLSQDLDEGVHHDITHNLNMGHSKAADVMYRSDISVPVFEDFNLDNTFSKITHANSLNTNNSFFNNSNANQSANNSFSRKSHFHSSNSNFSNSYANDSSSSNSYCDNSYSKSSHSGNLYPSNPYTNHSLSSKSTSSITKSPLFRFSCSLLGPSSVPESENAKRFSYGPIRFSRTKFYEE